MEIGAAGFEPANAGVKVPRLTTCRRPKTSVVTDNIAFTLKPICCQGTVAQFGSKNKLTIWHEGATKDWSNLLL